MELVLFIGIQATGKSTFYQQTFADTHIRLNLDMLKTRNRESILLAACLEAKQACVVDNTNPTQAERSRYIKAAQPHGFRITGFFFASGIQAALNRNMTRPAQQIVPEAGLRGTRNRLELPHFSEGFDTLNHVTILDDGRFVVQEWNGDI